MVESSILWFQKVVIYIVVAFTTKKMQVSNPNNIKIYNLSCGKSLPDVSDIFFNKGILIM